jgi:hypothetical protein
MTIKTAKTATTTMKTTLSLGLCAGLAACGDGSLFSTSDGPLQRVALPAGIAAALDLDENLTVRTPGLDGADLAAFQAACNDEAMDRLNADSGDFIIPPTPTLPTFANDSALCDEAARIETLVGRCGPLTPSTGATLQEAIDACVPGTTCHIVLPAGDFDGDVGIGCAVLEGAGDATRIRGTVSASDSVIARVAIEADYAAIGPVGDLLVSETALRAGYEGLQVSWGADVDVTVCRSRIAAGASGASQSWDSQRLSVVQSAVSACYEAVGTSWGSQHLLAQENVLLAGYSGVNIHQSLASVVVGNTIFGAYEAVGITSWEDVDTSDPYTPNVEGVFVSDNAIIGGSLPASQPERDIIVQ